MFDAKDENDFVQMDMNDCVLMDEVGTDKAGTQSCRE
jgi:hypothetical protein